MTGTAKTEEVEFDKTYKLQTTVIPTNRKISREDWTDQVFKTETAKWRAVAKEISAIHQQGRPVLVGTTSVEKSELISALLEEEQIPHNLLNAKPENVQRESEIVAQAGRSGAVTIATNMAGRGTDIILGGNSDYMAKLKIKELLSSRLIKPEEGHKPPIPLQRTNESVGFQETDKKQKKNTSQNSLNKLFPVTLSDETDKELANLSAILFTTWNKATKTID